jgi:hypothetical protein
MGMSGSTSSGRAPNDEADVMGQLEKRPRNGKAYRAEPADRRSSDRVEKPTGIRLGHGLAQPLPRIPRRAHDTDRL